ncbi:hypothetical protein HHK36_031090 [Tetracentron sinense]|uniref:Dirigent protein n=1 Tax=Tetracentron sinense TaxID=13715 RepID=A0A834Y8Y9_TETSI|nr:hypothetical protein HHK36_031090 [Tetracentron sinense]
MGTDGGDSGEASDSIVGGRVTINIRCSNGSKFSVQIGLESTVAVFKAILAQNCDTPVEQQRGKKPSAVMVAHPNTTIGFKSATPFGSVYTIDDPLTQGPEPTSKMIGCRLCNVMIQEINVDNYPFSNLRKLVTLIDAESLVVLLCRSPFQP